MKKKKTLTIGIAIIAVCLLVVVVNLFANRSEKREPTAAEMEASALYTVNWQEATGMEGTDMEIILSLCDYVGEEPIGENVYDTYTSDALGNYLPGFGEMMRIALLEDTVLYIQYTTPEGDMITLGYDGEGQCEKSIYDADQDTMYYETRETREVWTKFRGGIQWGA